MFRLLKKKKWLIIAVGFVCLVALGIWFGVENGQENASQEESIVTYGNVDIRQVELGFRVYGKVRFLHFEEGDYVKKGDLLAEIDPQPYFDDLKKAQGRLNALNAAYRQAKINWERRKQLSNPNAISREEYDNALYEVKRLKGEVMEAQGALELAVTNLEDTKIIAPSSGNILTRIREPGTVVTIGEPVYTLAIESPVWVRTYVAEPSLGKIYYGMSAEIFTDTESLPTYKGHIGFISPEAEFTPKNVETTRLRTDLVYRLRVIVENPDHYLKQGMPVTVKLLASDEKQ